MGKTLQWGQMYQGRSGGMHTHMVGTGICSASEGLGILCVFRCLPCSQARRLPPLGKGRVRQFLFAESLGAPSLDRAGRAQPAFFIKVHKNL